MDPLNTQIQVASGEELYFLAVEATTLECVKAIEARAKLLKMNKQEIADIRQAIVAKPDISAEVFVMYFNTGDDKLLAEIARNPKCPDFVATSLSQSKILDVAVNLAKNTAVVAILQKLATDNSPKVRFGVATNRNTPVDVLEDLCDDDDKSVAKEAESTLSKVAARQ